jgi:pyruvate,water dikinase
MSFAGQQDTFLNVRGPQAVLEAVVECWSSLWTARAIAYRQRNGIAQAEVALAVVIQAMVHSQASGVLFTANPLTGLRTETVIDATLGLGEALVSGLVDPDHYVVSVPQTGQASILSVSLGSKAIATHGLAGGGTSTQASNAARIQALPDEAILELAHLGQQVAGLYGSPQDIEWAWVEDRIYLLQSRPITSLYPIPIRELTAAEPLRVYFSFGAVQGMLNPLTPLGQDMIREVFATASGLFGLKRDLNTQSVIATAGERLWIDITSVARNTMGRRILLMALSKVEPTIRQAILPILDDPRLKPERAGIRLANLAHILRFALPLGCNLVLNLLAPAARRASLVSRWEATLSQYRAETQPDERMGDPYFRLACQVSRMRTFVHCRVSRLLIGFVSGVAAGMASFNLVDQLASQIPAGQTGIHPQARQNLVLEVTRGLPHNPTTEMDLELWRISNLLRSDPVCLDLIENRSPNDLSGAYRTRKLPALLLEILDGFLDRYGGRGLGEIDMGRKRWQEDPTHVIEVIGSYVQIKDSNMTPDAVFERGRQSSQAAIQRLSQGLQGSRLGHMKAGLLRLAAGRARELMGMREHPKFFIVRLLWQFKQDLQEIGQDLVKAGVLADVEDVFYLGFEELIRLSTRENTDWKLLIGERRAAYQREALRKQIPRLLLSDGRAFYEGIRADGDNEHTFSGSPVSPGSLEGLVRVVLDPRQAGLLPGEILVCPGTDPSWTPLFLAAGGLIMEVGGMMTHGAVVAREYGIPAIVGVDQATTRLHTGQRIRMDGAVGRIEILEENSAL